MTFDQVLPTLVLICERNQTFHGIKRACAVRDIKGCVRLVLEPDAGQTQFDIDTLRKTLEQSLAAQLEKYFAGPIWIRPRAGINFQFG